MTVKRKILIAGIVIGVLLVYILSQFELYIGFDKHEITFNETGVLTAYVSNTGNIKLANVVAELHVPDGVNVSEPLVKNIGALNTGDTREVRWNITATTFGYNDFRITVSNDIFSTEGTTYLLVSEKGHNIDLKIDGNDVTKRRNTLKITPVNFTISVVNTGTKEDTVDIYVFPHGFNWTTILYDAGTKTTTSPYRVAVPAGATRRLDLQLTPYPHVEVGSTFNVEIRGISEKNRSKDDRVVAIAIVAPEMAPLFEFTPPSSSLTINHNSSSDFNITLMNTGLSALTNITLKTSGTISSWISLSKDEIPSIGTGRSENVSIMIYVPKYTSPDTYRGIVEISSDNGVPDKVEISVLVPQSYKVNSEIFPTIIAALPGDTARYNVFIKNEGNVFDVYGVSFENESLIKSWIGINKSIASLYPGDTRTISFDIMPPCNYSTSAGLYNFVVNVNSQRTFKKIDAALQVPEFFKDYIVEICSQTVNPKEK